MAPNRPEFLSRALHFLKDVSRTFSLVVFSDLGGSPRSADGAPCTVSTSGQSVVVNTMTATRLLKRFESHHVEMQAKLRAMLGRLADVASDWTMLSKTISDDRLSR